VKYVTVFARLKTGATVDVSFGGQVYPGTLTKAPGEALFKGGIGLDDGLDLADLSETPWMIDMKKVCTEGEIGDLMLAIDYCLEDKTA
jgi:hypothetical protein